MSLCCAGITDASRFAREYLSSLGIATEDSPGPDVGEVLLDVPSFEAEGILRGGRPLEDLALREDIQIYGGNLQSLPGKFRDRTDFLQDPLYLAENAAITADAAVSLMEKQKLPGAPLLILGWGRIGKCLARKLRELGADVTVAARKETDRAMLKALGYHSADPVFLRDSLHHYKGIVNTVPALLLGKEELEPCTGFKMDLASRRGLEGDDVLWARGLPGKYAPEASGALIARTFLRLRKELPSWN